MLPDCATHDAPDGLIADGVLVAQVAHLFASSRPATDLPNLFFGQTSRVMDRAEVRRLRLRRGVVQMPAEQLAATVVMWDDVPADQRAGGGYQSWGPTQHRGCKAAVKWPGQEGYHRCAGNAMQATNLCRKHSERLGLVAPIFHFEKRKAHNNETGELEIAGRARSSTDCVECGRQIKGGELVSLRRNGVHRAICVDCRPIHEAPGYWHYGEKAWKYRPELRVEGCAECTRELSYLRGHECPTCGGSGRVDPDA